MTVIRRVDAANMHENFDEHLPVHTFGKCGNFTCPAPPDENVSTEECATRLRKYIFFLTFENSLCEDTLQKNTGGLDFKTILAHCTWRCKLQKNSQFRDLSCSKLSNCRTISKVYWVLRQQWHGVRCLFWVEEILQTRKAGSYVRLSTLRSDTKYKAKYAKSPWQFRQTLVQKQMLRSD